MAKTLDQKLQELSPQRQQSIKARTSALIFEERTLQTLRKQLDMTQEEMARRLQIGQENISRLEKRSDMKLSTLQAYIEALGGELDLTVQFPGHTPIKLQDIGGNASLKSLT